jgi:hypothetical protein
MLSKAGFPSAAQSAMLEASPPRTQFPRRELELERHTSIVFLYEEA